MKKEAITRPTTAQTGVRTEKSGVSSLCVAGVARKWKIWWWLDIVLRLSPAVAADDDETGGLPPLPTRVLLSLLPPGAGIGVGCDEVPTSLTLSSTTPNPIERQGPPSPLPPADLQPRHPSPHHPHHPTPDAEEKHQQNCSLSSSTRSRRDCRSSWFSNPHWISCLTWPEIYRTVLGNPLAWRANYLRRPIRHQRGDIYY